MGGFTCVPDKLGFCAAAEINQSACLNTQNLPTHGYDSYHKLFPPNQPQKQDCKWGAWSEWGECIAESCGVPGKKTRTRDIEIEANNAGENQ